MDVRRLILLIGIVFVLAACGDGTLEVNEDDFIKTYETETNRNLPTNITVYEEMVRIENATTEEAADFLKAAYKEFGQSEIDRLRISIENEEENIPIVINGDGYMINYLYDDNLHTISIVPIDE